MLIPVVRATVLPGSDIPNNISASYTTPDALMTVSGYADSNATVTANLGQAGTWFGLCNSNASATIAGTECITIRFATNCGLNGLDHVWTHSQITISGFTSDPGLFDPSGFATNVSYMGGTLTYYYPSDGGTNHQMAFLNLAASVGRTLRLNVYDSVPGWQAAISQIEYGTTGDRAPIIAQKFFDDTVAGSLRDNFTGISGTVFTANPAASNRIVTHLGYYDQGRAGGLKVSHRVGIYAAATTGSGAGTLLAEVTVPAGFGAPLENGYRWVALTNPLTLTNKASYVLAAEVFSNCGDAFPDAAPQVWNGYFIGTNFSAAGACRWSTAAWPHEPEQAWGTNWSYGVANLGCAAGGAPCRILCIGDSITAGYLDNPNWSLPFEFGYRSGLLTRLTSLNFPFQYVGHSGEPWNGASGVPDNTPAPDIRLQGQDHHEGHSGQNTAYVEQNILGWLSATAPDVVLLMIGINDLAAGSTGTSVSAQTNLFQIVRAIVGRCPQTHVIVAQITPYVTDTPSIKQYNNFITNTLVPGFSSRGKLVTTVDQTANFLQADGSINTALYANGWNHPNAAGYDLMAQTWLGGIEKVLPIGQATIGCNNYVSNGAFDSLAQSPWFYWGGGIYFYSAGASAYNAETNTICSLGWWNGANLYQNTGRPIQTNVDYVLTARSRVGTSISGMFLALVDASTGWNALVASNYSLVPVGFANANEPGPWVVSSLHISSATLVAAGGHVGDQMAVAVGELTNGLPAEQYGWMHVDWVQLAPAIPQFGSQPQSVSLNVGASATLRVGDVIGAVTNATGVGSGLAFQWYQNGTAIAGATNRWLTTGGWSSSLTIASVDLTNAGNYHVAATGPFGTGRSIDADLRIATTNAFAAGRIDSIRLINGKVSLTFICAANFTYQVQASTNLTAWNTVFSTNGVNGAFQFDDSTALPASVFYRLMWNSD